MVGEPSVGHSLVNELEARDEERMAPYKGVCGEFDLLFPGMPKPLKSWAGEGQPQDHE